MSSIRHGTAIDVCITAYDRRVYVQDESNWIVEFICSDGKWSEGKRLVEAAPGAGFSAVWWDQLGIANSELDIYYVNTDFVLSEMCWRKEKGWWSGSLATKNWQLHSQSQIAARVQQTNSSSKTSLRILVGAQREDNTIQVFVYQSEWKTPSGNLGKGLPGTSLTAPDHKFQNRFYYQTPDLKIVEIIPEDDGGWKTNTVRDQAPKASGLASWQGAMYMPRLFYVKPDGMAAEHCADGYGGWWSGNFSTEISEGSRLGACLDAKQDDVYVYVQSKDNPSKITEWRGGKWKVTNVLPPDV